ncbi:amidoligase family protein [Ancylobacter sp. 6x-1]|uniref:Amidoligase family protein n=1 Tax=Ancylobacter crimeensis TaxID=2579147 RepID=A0ABT0DAB1_9HYPH|nr:amidoligase family protein [Ancylobacter crimeensis]
MPSDELDRLAPAIDVLREAGARGRGGSWLDSLGLHFNIEQAEPDARRIAAVLKAFLLLEPWLRREVAPDLAGRLHQPSPFPAAYVRKVLAPSYWPTLAGLAADYVHANPTRKRSLDLLPLLRHYGPADIEARISGKVKPRPSFHYRLPRAFVGKPGWSIAGDWQRWLAVERLSGDEAALAHLSAARRDGRWIDGTGLMPAPITR